MNITKPVFDNAEIRFVQECLNSGWVTQGPFVQKFENIFAQRHSVEHALATTSCTAALHLAMLALGIGPGDEVIVPAFTWITSAHSVEYTGAKVVFADIDPATFNMDPNAFEAAITPRTKGVVAVHLFGLPAPMDEIITVARKHNLFVVEDAACAIGTEYDGHPVGGIGDAGCFSFHPRKVVTTGEGGMLTTNRSDIAEKVKSFRNHGSTGHFLSKTPEMNKPYYMGPFDMLGYNLRLSDIQASVGVAQMAKLDTLLAERKAIAGRYNEKLKGMDGFEIPRVPGKCTHTYQSYVIRITGSSAHERRNSIMDEMAAANIQTRPGTHAVHRQGYYKNKYSLKPEMFPNAAMCEDTTITLPVFHGMTDDEQDQVVEKIKALRK